jgi:hypothetical protein
VVVELLAEHSAIPQYLKVRATLFRRRDAAGLGWCLMANLSAFGLAGSFSGLAVGELADDVEVADVAGVFL